MKGDAVYVSCITSLLAVVAAAAAAGKWQWEFTDWCKYYFWVKPGHQKKYNTTTHQVVWTGSYITNTSQVTKLLKLN